MAFKQTAVNRNFLLSLLYLPLALACGKNNGDNLPGMEAVSYEPTDAIIANPERGFYSAQEIFSVSSKGISRDGAAANRKNYRTLYLLEFHLKDFVNSDISEEYLQTIRTYFQSMRDGGAKCILRFCYSNGMNESDKPWDASPAQTLRHVAQIKPILQEYDDIIFVVQAGFIGSWGEWYYTENYDNASRKALLEALLDAVPASRQIELRTPAFKMNLYGYSLADTLTSATAHTTDVKARLAGHNDCYLASANDQGTFSNSNERKFWTAESAYTIMGGETCATSAYCDCQPKETPKAAHGALADLAQYHFTYMNQGYHQGVLNRWKTGGCFEEIQKRLGYRYVLDKGQFTDSPAAGAAFRIVLDLHNEGFSPVQNPRDAEFVLTDKGGKVLETYPLNSDPRYWMAGESVTVDQTLTLPSGISGEVTLWLNLPDPCENLRNNPLYSIRLANKDVWDEETGYNKLHTLTL